jgi:hypothetical protein
MANESREATLSDLRCLECLREWLDPRERWRMYVTADAEPECGLYCAMCAAFEFDEE